MPNHSTHVFIITSDKLVKGSTSEHTYINIKSPFHTQKINSNSLENFCQN